MTLLTLWHGEVDIPSLPRRRIKIGGNVVEQTPLLGFRVYAEMKTCDVPGHDLLVTKLRVPFDRMLVRRKGAKRRDAGFPVLTANGEMPEQWGAIIQLTHVSFGLSDKITGRSWGRYAFGLPSDWRS